MNPAEYRAVAYRTGYHFARERLRPGEDPDSVRLALRRGLEHLRALGAHSADLGGMMRRGVEFSRLARYTPPLPRSRLKYVK